jgi:hypothetical protein
MSALKGLGRWCVESYRIPLIPSDLRQAQRKEGRKEGKEGGREEGREGGRKEGRKLLLPSIWLTGPSYQAILCIWHP